MRLKIAVLTIQVSLLLIAVAGCKKDSPTETPAASRRELLTHTPWQVSKATDLSSTPGQPKDITIIFASAGLLFHSDGSYLFTGNVGTWELTESDTKIILDKNTPSQLTIDILELSDSKLKIKALVPTNPLAPILCEITLIPSVIKPINTEDYFTQKTESRHFAYYYSQGDQVDTLTQESYFDWLLNELKVTVDSKLQYYKYKNRNDMISITQKEVNGWADPLGNGKFHSIWPSDNHECVHAVMLQKIGFAVALFSEGLAVAHSAVLVNGKYVPEWNGSDLNKIAQYYKKNGQLPPLNNLIESGKFRNVSENITYPISGSFVRFVIDKYGMNLMKAYIKVGNYNDTNAIVRSNFMKIYGIELDGVWDEWLNFVDSENSQVVVYKSYD